MTVAAQAGFVEFQIEDDGVGIPEEERSRIFDRGARLDTGKPGTGLGLAIVRDVAEIYEGTVSLEKLPGSGRADGPAALAGGELNWRPASPLSSTRMAAPASKMGDKLVSTLRDAFEAAGAAADVKALDGGSVGDAIKKAAKTGRVVVAGGDGTAACAAQQLAGGDAELGLLPLGTLNHLARDLGLPTELEDAAKVAATGDAHRDRRRRGQRACVR